MDTLKSGVVLTVKLNPVVNIPNSAYMYARIKDNFVGLQIASIVRVSNNKTLRAPENAWRTSRTSYYVGQDPVVENWLHLFDGNVENDTLVYRVIFVGLPPAINFRAHNENLTRSFLFFLFHPSFFFFVLIFRFYCLHICLLKRFPSFVCMLPSLIHPFLSMQLSWNHTNPNVTQYQLNYRPSVPLNGSWIPLHSNWTGATFSVNGLTQATWYDFQIFAGVNGEFEYSGAYTNGLTLGTAPTTTAAYVTPFLLKSSCFSLISFSFHMFPSFSPPSISLHLFPLLILFIHCSFFWFGLF